MLPTYRTPWDRSASSPFADLPSAPPLNTAFPTPSGRRLPEPPPGFTGGLADRLQRLPEPPPSTRQPGTAFDDDNYQQTMLKLASGFFGSQNFGDGLAHAAGTIAQTNDGLRKAEQPVLGGPDDAFEIYTDPRTGERSYREIKQFSDYRKQKDTDPAEAADMTGRVMYAISQLPEDQRAATYDAVLSDPGKYGISDSSVLPATYDPSAIALRTNMGMSVSQARARDQAALNGDRADQSRQEALAITRARAAASTAQGAQRLNLAREALDRRGTTGSGKGTQQQLGDMSTADLLNFIGAN